MAIIILPWYIYFIIRRSRIQAQAAINVNYALLNFEKIYPEGKLEGWREISNATSSHVNIKDEEIERKYIARVYRRSSSQCDMSSKTALEVSSSATEGSRNSKPTKPVQIKSIINDNETDDDNEFSTHSITGTESTEVPKNIPISIDHK
ncbi:hypothetical protein ACH3XW_18560 [Acanthocheilonema viteae]|uniref:Uncharacterized protein n=1 Tax=Acanthocheilonema viteae TaxID=6277 RepID=A0A498SIR7_ACAVI|nr:unnamed protein product [Acanthocheilonema viteae]